MSHPLFMTLCITYLFILVTSKLIHVLYLSSFEYDKIRSQAMFAYNLCVWLYYLIIYLNILCLHICFVYIFHPKHLKIYFRQLKANKLNSLIDWPSELNPMKNSVAKPSPSVHQILAPPWIYQRRPVRKGDSGI